LRSQNWKTSDLQLLLRLSNALHAVADPVGRKRRLLEGLCELVSGVGGLLLVTRTDHATGKQAVVSATELGLSTTPWPGASPPLNSNPHATFEIPPVDQGCMDGPLTWEAAMRVLPAGALPWPPLLLAHRPRQRRGDPLTICSTLPLSGPSELTASLCLFRPSHQDGRFTERHRKLVNLFHAEATWVYHPDLLLASRDADALSPRERQTLEHLLAGHSEKQIAGRLKLSPNTVHHYVKSLHRHFGVSSRSELLARWVGK
jgi:DNA-binding CsgD family transcriptional regulator